MGFKNEIFQCLNGLGVAPTYRFSLVGGIGGYFENVLSVNEVTPSEIFLSLKTSVLRIKGERLSVAKYCDGDLVVSGKIFLVEVVE